MRQLGILTVLLFQALAWSGFSRPPIGLLTLLLPSGTLPVIGISSDNVPVNSVKVVEYPVTEKTRRLPVPFVATFGAALAQLELQPHNIDVWKTVLKHCKKAKIARKLPAGVFKDSPQDVVDAELCLIKGEVMVRCSHLPEGKLWLRSAPELAASRLRAFEITSRAALIDPDFSRLVALGDRHRDAREWEAGEHHYWQALNLYPHHAGYITQYAHCLKEQGKLVEAEIFYRSALAYALRPSLAVPWGLSRYDIQSHVEWVAGQLGYYERESGLTGDEAASTPLGERPTKRDIDLVFDLLYGHRLHDAGQVLDVMRMCKTIECVFLWAIEQREFSTVNRDLLSVCASFSSTT